MPARSRTAALLGGVLFAIGATAIDAPSAAASQGGCDTYTPGGHSIGICVNDRNTGTNAYPDYYVNSPLPSNCRIQVELWDDSNHRFGPIFQDSGSCSQGHHPASGAWCNVNWDPASYGDGVFVHAYFRLYINGAQVNNTSTNSPSISLTYTGNAHC